MNCLYCNKETNNPKFCSRSCAVTYSNKKNPKRKLTRKCLQCENRVKSYRHTRCEEHWSLFKKTKYKDKTLEEYQNLNSVKGKHSSWKNAHIRILNRHWNKDKTNLPCAKCGYDKHVELCHIKAITDFPITAKIGDINAADNVIQLCPNCHWEMDNL